MLALKNGGADMYDKSEIMRKAHHEYRMARMRGDTRGFGFWLSYSWRVAKSRRGENGDIPNDGPTRRGGKILREGASPSGRTMDRSANPSRPAMGSANRDRRGGLFRLLLVQESP